MNKPGPDVHSLSASCPTGKPGFVAHVRAGSADYQSLQAHLHGVSRLAAEFASKFGCATHGELIGLLHDLGKFSEAFQTYIQSATGLLNQDEDEEFVDAAGLKGKIDHSTKRCAVHLAGVG